MSSLPEVVAIERVPIADHQEVVEAHHRFAGIAHMGTPWDLTHLDAFALRLDPDLGFAVDVVVLFSCHCFTRSHRRDGRDLKLVPSGELFDNGRESRVLCRDRYTLSRRFLPQLVADLVDRTIKVARATPLNFFTAEAYDEATGTKRQYVIFFDVTKCTRRKKRLLLHVQSAYAVDELTDRQSKAGKVRFKVLLKAAYEGRKIKG